MHAPAHVSICVYMIIPPTPWGFTYRVHSRMQDWHQISWPSMNLYKSAFRVSVEWIFGDIVNSFKFIDFRKNLKIGLSSVGKLYIVCALLQNAITCLYGNKTSTYFDLQPPTVQEYFTWRYLHFLHVSQLKEDFKILFKDFWCQTLVWKIWNNFQT